MADMTGAERGRGAKHAGAVLTSPAPSGCHNLAKRHDVRPASGRRAEAGPSSESPHKPEPRTGHSRARFSGLLPAFALLLGALWLSAPAQAQQSSDNTHSYKRGNIRCDDFQKAKEKYELDSEGGYAVTYAGCLLAKGEDDVRALNILEVEAISRNQVPAARLMALYTASDGTMKENNLEENNYNEAFQAYGRVIHLIHRHPDYPKDFMITELKEQHELEAYYHLVRISYKKYLAGLKGSHNTYLLQSPTYEGRRNLPLRPKYNPYTLDSLKQTIENAGICTKLPQKAYFQALLYDQTIKYCKMIKEVAQELLVLERERLTLLNDPLCTRDIEQCYEYQEVAFNEIIPLIKEGRQKNDKIWSASATGR